MSGWGGDTSGTDGGQSRLATRLDDTFASLAHPRRRHLLAELPASPSESMSLAAAARRVRCREASESERDCAASPATTAENESSHPTDVYVSLRHVHVPKLADADLVRYDTAADTVSRTELTEAALSLVTRAERELAVPASPALDAE